MCNQNDESTNVDVQDNGQQLISEEVAEVFLSVEDERIEKLKEEFKDQVICFEDKSLLDYYQVTPKGEGFDLYKLNIIINSGDFVDIDEDECAAIRTSNISKASNYNYYLDLSSDSIEFYFVIPGIRSFENFRPLINKLALDNVALVSPYVANLINLNLAEEDKFIYQINNLLVDKIRVLGYMFDDVYNPCYLIRYEDTGIKTSIRQVDLIDQVSDLINKRDDLKPKLVDLTLDDTTIANMVVEEAVNNVKDAIKEPSSLYSQPYDFELKVGSMIFYKDTAMNHMVFMRNNNFDAVIKCGIIKQKLNDSMIVMEHVQLNNQDGKHISMTTDKLITTVVTVELHRLEYYVVIDVDGMEHHSSDHIVEFVDLIQRPGTILLGNGCLDFVSKYMGIDFTHRCGESGHLINGHQNKVIIGVSCNRNSYIVYDTSLLAYFLFNQETAKDFMDRTSSPQLANSQRTEMFAQHLRQPILEPKKICEEKDIQPKFKFHETLFYFDRTLSDGCGKICYIKVKIKSIKLTKSGFVYGVKSINDDERFNADEHLLFRDVEIK